MSIQGYVLSETGHIAIAKMFFDKEMFLAWGTTIPALASPSTLNGTTATTSGATLSPSSYEYAISAINSFGETLPRVSSPITLESPSNSIVLTWTAVPGATGYRIYRKVGTVYNLLKSVGTVTTLTDTGLTTTDEVPATSNSTGMTWSSNVPEPNSAHTSLYSEVGRRKVLIKKYVKPDANGEIETVDGKWTAVDQETKHVYIQVGFQLKDAPDKTIYQFGLFTDVVPATGYENANYLLPNQISDPGWLFANSNVAPIIRNEATREVRELVLTF